MEIKNDFEKSKHLTNIPHHLELYPCFGKCELKSEPFHSLTNMFVKDVEKRKRVFGKLSVEDFLR